VTKKWVQNHDERVGRERLTVGIAVATAEPSKVLLSTRASELLLKPLSLDFKIHSLNWECSTQMQIHLS
jgi:hypothetical protein